MNAEAFVFQSVGKPSRFSKTVLRPDACEDDNRILGVFVEIGVEDALIHEVGLPLMSKEDPAQVMQLEHGEAVRLIGHGFLDVLGVLVEDRLPSGDDLRDDREAVASRSFGKDRAVPTLLNSP